MTARHADIAAYAGKADWQAEGMDGYWCTYMQYSRDHNHNALFKVRKIPDLPGSTLYDTENEIRYRAIHRRRNSAAHAVMTEYYSADVSSQMQVRSPSVVLGYWSACISRIDVPDELIRTLEMTGLRSLLSLPRA